MRHLGPDDLHQQRPAVSGSWPHPLDSIRQAFAVGLRTTTPALLGGTIRRGAMSNQHEKTKEATMKRTLMLSLLAALLGGCVVAPYGYRDSDDGYRYHSYYRNSYPGYYGYYNYGYPRSYGYYGFRYQDHGG